ncbi:hypothetical protein ACWGKW_07750 [Streptomyces sp. NPDC054766]
MAATATPQDGDGDSAELRCNGTSETENMDFTAKVSEAVGDGLSGRIVIKGSAVLAEVGPQCSVTSHASVAAELGNVVHVHVKHVPPRKAVHARYGVWRRKFTGAADYQHHTCCLTQNKVTGYGLMRAGWCTWGE